MNVSMLDLARVTLLAFLLGFILGAVFDAVTVPFSLWVPKDVADRDERPYGGSLKKRFRGFHGTVSRNIMISLRDMAFFLISGVVFSVFLYRFNYGRFRWFILVSLCLGYWAFRATAGRLTSCILGLLARLLILGVNIVLWAVIAPLGLFWRLIERILIMPVGKAVKKAIVRRRTRATADFIKNISKVVSFGEIGKNDPP